MCGITGWLSFDQPVDPEALRAMRDVLVHRGPDGAGDWYSEDQRVGFGHRRLSIIDLSTIANQPMVDADRRAVIVFNGEIYNHRQLRKELEQIGRPFTTSHSDTECLLQGYLAWGIDKLLEKLVGMFAFAIYEFGSQKVTLVRDRVGIKPLYFAKTERGLIFASEIKALLAHPEIKPELDRDSFNYHMTFRSLAPPRTLFRGIQCLAPSELMEIDLTTGISTHRTYWDPVSQAATAPSSLEQAEARLEELLHDSINLRLESDVPVGLFLSGGLDSGLVLQLIKDKVDGLGTYTIGYPGHDRYDESTLANEMATEAQTEHFPIELDEANFLDAFAKVAYYQDEPISAPVCTSVYFLSQRASATGRKVVLAGEGSDEIFFGYKTWRQSRDLQQWDRRIPHLPGRPFGKLASSLAGIMGGYNSKPAEMLRRTSLGQPVFWGGGLDFAARAKQELLGSSGKDDTYEAVIDPIYQEYLKYGDPGDTTLWMSYVDLRFRLPQLMLPRLDKMGMAFSIEGRVPFLDHRIIEFVFGLPPAWRGSTGNETKPLLKKVARKYLPVSIVDQRKKGFQAPVREWKHKSFGKHYLPLLSKFASQTGLFNQKAIEKLINQSDDRLYFSLVNFMVWHSIFISNDLNLDLNLER